MGNLLVGLFIGYMAFSEDGKRVMSRMSQNIKNKLKGGETDDRHKGLDTRESVPDSSE